MYTGSIPVLASNKKALRFEWPDWLPKEPISTSELLGQHRENLKNLEGQIDLIAGGPPCQGFSFAGRRQADDPRNQLKNEYLEIVDIIRPKYLVFENVKGFTAKFKDSESKTHSEQVVEQLESLEWGGYRTFSQVLNASIFGVPQPRPRFILVAVRSDLVTDKELANPFDDIQGYAADFKDSKKLNGHEISVSEAISDLEVSASGTSDSVETKGFRQINYRSETQSEFQTLMKKGLTRGKSANSLRLARHRPRNAFEIQRNSRNVSQRKISPTRIQRKIQH